MTEMLNTIGLGLNGVPLPKGDFRAARARGGAAIHLARYGQSWDDEPFKFVAVKKAFQILENSGALAKIDQMFFLALDENDSLLSWIIAGTAPVNQGMAFGPLGFEGDASAAYINTGINPTTLAGAKYTRDSAHFGVYVSDNVGVQSAANIAFGTVGGPSLALLYPMSTSANTAYRINGGETISFDDNPFHGQPGFMLVQRAGANTTRMLHDGNVIRAQSGDASTGIPNSNFCIGRNQAAYGGGKYAGGTIGAGMSVSNGQEDAVCQAWRLLGRACLP